MQQQQQNASFDMENSLWYNQFSYNEEPGPSWNTPATAAPPCNSTSTTPPSSMVNKHLKQFFFLFPLKTKDSILFLYRHLTTFSDFSHGLCRKQLVLHKRDLLPFPVPELALAKI